jgi:hypothetical protein
LANTGGWTTVGVGVELVVPDEECDVSSPAFWYAGMVVAAEAGSTPCWAAAWAADAWAAAA